jgi:hypothetical protein
VALGWSRRHRRRRHEGRGHRCRAHPPSACGRGGEAWRRRRDRNRDDAGTLSARRQGPLTSPSLQPRPCNAAAPVGSATGRRTRGLLVTTPSEIISYYRLNHFIWSLSDNKESSLSYGPPWAHCLGGYQDRLLGGPLGLPGLRYTAPEGVEHKDYTGVVLG